MDLTLIVAVGLAAGYLVIAWRDGSIFEMPRIWLEQGMLIERCRGLALGKFAMWAAEKLTDLLLCPLCLSPYTCFVLWCILWRSGLELNWVICLVSTFGSALISWAAYHYLNTRGA